MAKPGILVTRMIDEKGLSLLREQAELEIWPGELPPGKQDLLRLVQGKAGLLCLLSDQIDAEILDAAGAQLKVISTYAVGFDNIEVQEATERGIAVGNTPGILTDATADFAFALMMAAGRRVAEAERQVHAGKWQTWGPRTLLGADFVGATLGLIGYGRIGQAMAKRAGGFSMHVVFYDPTAEPVGGINAGKVNSLEELLAQSDFISLHVPLTEKTLHLVDADFLAHMKPNAILVNTARGAVVDQAALYEALKEKRIVAAALDVTEPEPLPMDSPLLTLENCLITPHIASASHQAREKMAVMAAENLLAGLRGEKLPHCVNPQVYLGK
jgi:glyoxylate reductase